MKTRIATAIDGTERPNVVFKPTSDFYKEVGIKRKRFGQLYRGEKSPLLSELESIARFTNVSLNDLI